MLHIGPGARGLGRKWIGVHAVRHGIRVSYPAMLHAPRFGAKDSLGLSFGQSVPPPAPFQERRNAVNATAAAALLPLVAHSTARDEAALFSMPCSATLSDRFLYVLGDGQREGGVLGELRDLEKFLAGVEQRAFRMARVALRNDDDALDVVQDAMLQLAQRYGAHPAAQWPPLFYRILQNRVRDYQRRRQVRNRLFSWWPTFASDDDAPGDPVDLARDEGPGIVDRLAAGEAMQLLEQALHALPARQQEAFMLRNFEGLDVAQTATAMGCSEGSVKTHYSRAVHTLRERLGDAW